MRLHRLKAPAFLALMALALVGCDRKPRFIPAGADSTGAVPADSAAIYVQMAREHWESPGSGEEAAELTARIVLQDLRDHASQGLTARARETLDSLHLGTEVAGSGEFAVANLFSRSDPGGGSWPHLFWRDSEATRHQALEATGMRLVGAAMEDDEDAPGARIAILYERQSGSRQTPFVYVWQRPASGSWRLVQSLGPDSLGAVGTARFVPEDAEGVVLVSRTHQSARGFDECATCPHVYRTRRFVWGTNGLVSAGEDVERSPYFAFVQLVQALTAGDREAAARWVADPSLLDAADGYGWGQARGLWRLAPASSPNSRELLLFRGNREAYRVFFSTRGDDWLVSGFEPTSRTIE